VSTLPQGTAPSVWAPSREEKASSMDAPPTLTKSQGWRPYILAGRENRSGPGGLLATNEGRSTLSRFLFAITKSHSVDFVGVGNPSVVFLCDGWFVWSDKSWVVLASRSLIIRRTMVSQITSAIRWGTPRFALVQMLPFYRQIGGVVANETSSRWVFWDRLESALTSPT